MKKVLIVFILLLTCVSVYPESTRTFIEINNPQLTDQFSIDFLDLFNKEKWQVIRQGKSERVLGLEGVEIVFVFYRNLNDPDLMVFLMGEGEDGFIAYLQRVAVQYGYDVISVMDRYKDTEKWYKWTVESFCRSNPDNEQCKDKLFDESERV